MRLFHVWIINGYVWQRVENLLEFRRMKETIDLKMRSIHLAGVLLSLLKGSLRWKPGGQRDEILSKVSSRSTKQPTNTLTNTIEKLEMTFHSQVSKCKSQPPPPIPNELRSAN